MLATKPRKAGRSQISPAGKEVLKRRTREALSLELSFIPNAAFHEMDEAKHWRVVLTRPKRRTHSGGKATSKYKNDLPIEQLCEAPLLTAEEERELFRNMNYMKFRANQIRSTLSERRPSRRKLEQFDAAVEKADELRNEIIAANTRLVVSIVKKFTDDRNTFDDMLSDGITSLMKAVEKFNYDRGFRYSTYATMVIRRALYRVMERTQRTKTRFVTGQTEILDGEYREMGDVAPTESTIRSRDERIATILEELDDRERFIIEARCGFADLGMKATFANLGDKLGVCKERVRQLELRGMEKLRNAIVELGFVGELRDLVVR